ncbi:MAG: cell division protein ZapE [Chloroflexota bacterium]|nr:cell division protein ZapE [Chloroflexota bacterium]
MHRLPEVHSLEPAELLRGFVPTRRFAHVSFDSYVPDPRYPSQSAALARMRDFAAALRRKRSRLPWWARARPPAGRGVYLDGGYGVGKTHLLAATYHAAPGTRVYLSFAELAYSIARLGLGAALDAFGRACLVCVDEFELDDVAQTRMASAFLRHLFERGETRVVTTSNTLPSDLGQGRFAAEAFQREIGELAARFEVVSIDGEDFRHRHWDELARPRAVDSSELRRLFESDPSAQRVLVDWTELSRQLEGIHPVHYAQVAASLESLYVDGLSTIQDQAVALRLVHFVDKLYDQEVALSVACSVPLPEVFAASYRHGGYEKKYRRCLSRLHELLAETAAARARSGPGGERVAVQVELG